MKKISVIIIISLSLSIFFSSCGVETDKESLNISIESLEYGTSEEVTNIAEYDYVDSFVYPSENLTECQTLPVFSDIENPNEYAMLMSITTIEEFDQYITGTNKSFDETLIVTGSKISSRSYYVNLGKEEMSIFGTTVYSDKIFRYTLTRFKVEKVSGGSASVKAGDLITVAEKYSYNPDGKVVAFGYTANPPMYESENYLLFLGKKENKAVFQYGSVEDAWLPAAVILIDVVSSGKVEATVENFRQKGYFTYYKAGIAAIEKYAG